MTLPVHPGSEVEDSKVNWSKVPIANPKSFTYECFDSDVQLAVRVANNDFLILKFPRDWIIFLSFILLSVHLL